MAGNLRAVKPRVYVGAQQNVRLKMQFRHRVKGFRMLGNRAYLIPYAAGNRQSTLGGRLSPLSIKNRSKK